jgi:hypothetical protein
MECIVPVALAVVINDAWNALYRWHRPWLLMMHGMHRTKNITAPNNINGASIHPTGGIERGY